MKKINIHLQVMLMIFTINLGGLTAQTSPMPSTTGTNSVSYNPVLNVYEFNCNGITIYRYEKSNGGYGYNSGATFHAIQALGADYNWFYPSNVGGITVWLAGAERMPWDAGVTYTRLTPDPTIVGNTVTSYWRMQYGTDYIDYRYDLTISGKTLIINVDALGDTKATGINFDRCENANNPRNVVVPYLNLFNILFCNQGYTSLFVDWETTNCSTIYPLDPSEYPCSVSNNSVHFASHVKYEPKTNGFRNPLKETIYLTTSANINEVLPNLVGSIAPRKLDAVNRTVLSYGPPYTWLFNPPTCSGYTYNYLTEIKNRGVNDLAVIIKNYQRLGFDSGYPAVLPANNWDGTTTCSNYDRPCQNTSTDNALLIATKNSINALGYKVALHENYVDCYDNGSAWFTLSDRALKSDGTLLQNWPYGGCDHNTFSNVFNAGKAINYLSTWSNAIKTAIGPYWSYLDVHSAINPSSVVDYDANPAKDSSGYFKYVLHRYRALPKYLRDNNIYPGPIEGEGQCHFLYVGWFDDFEGSLYTANYYVYGWKAPLLVDFDLNKMHLKSAIHGVGHYQTFFKPTYNTTRTASLTMDEILLNIAYELAFAHGGLVTKSNQIDLSIDQVVLENNYVLRTYKLIHDQTPNSIIYYANGTSVGDASTYIGSNTRLGWDDYTSSNFMSQVRVIYQNGVRIYVNRNDNTEWDVTSEVSGLSGKFLYNVLVGSSKLQDSTARAQYNLARGNGWLVYIPNGLAKLGNQSEEKQPTKDGIPTEYALQNCYPNPFNPTTTIKYELPQDGMITLKVYDNLGREVGILVNGRMEAGYHEVNFDAHKLASGVYIYTLRANDFVQSKKMILMK